MKIHPIKLSMAITSYIVAGVDFYFAKLYNSNIGYIASGILFLLAMFWLTIALGDK